MASRYLEEVRHRVVVFDGAMGTNIQARKLKKQDFLDGKEGWNESLVLTRPDVIANIHESFLAAGCDVLETNTFGANRLKLGEYGHGTADDVRRINLAAAQLARHCADKFAAPDRPRFVAGAVGPTGMLPSTDDPELGGISFDQLADIFAEQAQPLVEGGCDLLLIETSQDMLEVKAAVAGFRQCFRAVGRSLPIQAQVTLDVTQRMLLGTDIGAAMTTLEALRVDVIGLNCSTGPREMRDPVRFLCEHSRRPVSVIPNAGIPENRDGQAVYPETPADFARHLGEFVAEFGVNVVGGCCGTTPEHLRAVVEVLARVRPKKRELA
ncbi:MAG: homocysteine S-methyltransferase family protein [Verrucomicrobiae bacterium]|nr:homocysteine S-methyltransferase family protein [Verrucomicrobiae bacterium]